VKRIDLDDANLYILTPYPGTALYAQFQKEGRLLDGTRRTQFGWSHAVFRPKLMTPGELEEGVQRTYDNLYVHFRRQFLKKVLRRYRLLLKNPRLVGVLVGGALRRARVRAEPETV
jgi:hypothetical protein